MTDVLEENKIIQEILNFLRNSDIFSTTVRGVTTTTNTATLSTASTYSISTPGVRNIRTLSIDAVNKSYGSDYTIAFGTSSSANTILTFTTAQTGTLSITYDYGTSDKIYSDYPRNDLSLSQFPRCACDVLDMTTEPGGFGNVNISKIDFTVIFYATKVSDVKEYIALTRKAFIDNQDSFYYFNVIKPISQSPIFKTDFEKGKDKIVQKSIDLRSYLNYEVNN